MQNRMAGTTDYRMQSLEDIRVDIVDWIKQAKEIKTLFLETVDEAKRTKYWENVGYDYAALCERVPKIIDVFCGDLELVIKAIDKEHITNREISLLNNVCECAHEMETWFFKAFKDKDVLWWHDYKNPKFHALEVLYSEGRAFFFTLIDAGNVVERIRDFIREEEKESFFQKYLWPIISGIIIAVAGAGICVWLGLK